MNLPSSFYVYLTSGDTRFEHVNHAGSFINRIQKKFRGYSYKCGLAELFFVDNYNNTSEQSTSSSTSSSSTPTTTLEPGAPRRIPKWIQTEFKKDEDWTVKIELDSPKSISFAKLSRTFNDYLKFVRARNEFANQLVITAVEGTNKTSITCKPVFANAYFEVSQALADILGFRQLKFEPGTYISDYEASQEAFDRASETTLLAITRIAVTRREVTVAKFTDNDNPSFHDIISHFQEELRKSNVNIFSIVEEEEEQLEITVIDDNERIYFPIWFNSIINNRSNIPLTSKSKYTAGFPPDRHEKPEPDLMFVCSNLIAPVQFGSVHMPLLRVIRRDASTQLQRHHTFDPIFYCPLSQDELEDVHVTILDSKHKVLESNYETIAVIHFLLDSEAVASASIRNSHYSNGHNGRAETLGHLYFQQ